MVRDLFQAVNDEWVNAHKPVTIATWRARLPRGGA
jgi:hypothetical protein